MALVGEMRYLQIGSNTYEIPTSELPIASSSTLGGIKVGTNLSIDSSTGVLSASFTETDPVFSASVAYGITQNDIDSWNAKISDTGKWNGVTLSRSFLASSGDLYVPVVTNNTATTANYYLCTSTPTANKIVRWNNDKYLISTTPSANDNSTKVATTAYVDAAIPTWAKASTKPSYTASEVGAVAISAVGAASGVVPLNASSKIDSTYLPSYVDDIVEGYYYNNKFWEEAAHTTEITGEAGKIYVDLSTNKTYRYSGTAYIEVSSGSLVTISRNLTSGTKSATINVDGTDYDIYSVTNTDQNVTQTAVDTSTGAQYRILLSNSTNDTTETNEVFKAGKLIYNPYNSSLIFYPNASMCALKMYYNDNIYFNLQPYGYSGNSSTYNAIVKFISGSGKDVILRGISTPSSNNDATNKLYVDTRSLPTGGTAGQVLKKTSSTDYAVEWGAVDALPVVTSSDNNKVLTVVNGAWAAANLPVYNGGVS